MSTTDTKDFQTQANEYAKGSIASIREMLDALNAAREADDQDAIEDAEQTIWDAPLSVEVRTGWYTPGVMDAAVVEEYNILLGTGGPASRIIGELEAGEPTSARFEHQDWFQPWTRAWVSQEDEDTMLEYARQFYFGE